jgi:uncharacterized protein (TIGR02611 family)
MKHALGRVGRSAGGALLVLLGVILVPLPGPGFLVIFAGLVVLARDYAWAQRLVDATRSRAEQAVRSAGRYLKRTKPGTSETSSEPPMIGGQS